MAKPKFYVVWKGARPGIYSNWQECSDQIRGFPGALYKAFPAKEEAEKAFKQNPYTHIGSNNKPATSSKKIVSAGIIPDCLCVDAAWNTETKVMEYRGVYKPTGEEIFHGGPFLDATNNIGEFLAIVHGLSLLYRKKNKIPVYSDSHTAIVWVRNKQAKTKLEKTPNNANLFQLIDRAECWLRDHVYENKVIKWETSRWGEIPADFGRK
jgi:ribonuclease HI